MPENIDLSIVIVNWNTRDLLAGCLSSLAPGCAGLAYETLLVDNASTDGSVDMVRRQFPQVELLTNSINQGFARANNQALARARGRFVLLLNSDTWVYPGALAILVAFMDRRPEAGASGARLLNADGSLQPSCHPMLTPGREFWRLMFLERVRRRATYPMQNWGCATPRPVEAIKGACLLVRRDALAHVGALDEEYFMYTEEVDLCRRLAQGGWELWWVPRSMVVHYGEASSRQVAENMYVQLYRSKVHFFRKFGGSDRADGFKRLLRLAYWPRYLSRATLAAPFSNSLAIQARTYHRLLTELASM